MIDDRHYVKITQDGADLLFLGCQEGDVVEYGDLFKLWRDLDTIVCHEPSSGWGVVVRPSILLTEDALFYASESVRPTLLAYFV